MNAPPVAPAVQVRCTRCDKLLAFATAGSTVSIVCPKCKAKTVKGL